MSSILPSFLEKYAEVVKKKNSILCVGLDPALPVQRMRQVIPNDDRLEFMRRIILDVAPFTSVIKMNRQYLIGLTVDEIRQLNITIHQQGMLSIIDHKLADIGSSNISAIFWFKEEGFDAFTFNPYGGNIEEATRMAHEKKLGIIVITLMSNPQAIIQKLLNIYAIPFFLHIAEICKVAKSDGCMIGAGSHIQLIDVAQIKQNIGNNAIALVPLMGPHKESAKNVILHFGDKAMISVGGAILYSDDPPLKACQFQEEFNTYREKVNQRSFGVLNNL
ncbi:MAG: orotidine 5'-phosphate decarboxylase [Candidatus Heimdallarchaeota archaeon]|nr:orotidine 5'-phosphate decarboxylase [Candidatus Heimdallarchaeota archaeon]